MPISLPNEPIELAPDRVIVFRLTGTVQNDGTHLETSLDAAAVSPNMVAAILREIADDVEDKQGRCDCGRPECEERNAQLDAAQN